VQAADALRLPATTVTTPVFWLILRIMLAAVSAIMMLPWRVHRDPARISATGDRAGCAEAGLGCRTPVADPVRARRHANRRRPAATVVMVYGSTSGAACAINRAVPSPATAIRKTVAFNSLNPTLPEPRRIIRPAIPIRC